MSETAPQNLSATRGNHAGLMFFRVWFKLFGFGHTVVMVWIITFFYMLFDREARKRTLPYIRHRFPEAGFFARLYHIWALFAHQGRALLIQQMFEHGEFDGEVWCDSAEAEALRHSETPLVVIYSHFGPWQALMGKMEVGKRKVFMLAQADANPNVHKINAVSGGPDMSQVVMVPAGPGCLTALQLGLAENAAAAVMGDRCLEDNPVQVDFLGAQAAFPVSGFYLAAKMKCPVVCIFARYEKTKKKYVLEFGTVMHPEIRGRNREQLVPFVERYVRRLESLCQEYPHDCFMLSDNWSIGKK